MWFRVGLFLCVTASCMGGLVRRDPRTGKWVESTEAELGLGDRRAKSSDDEGLFGGFDFFDSREQPSDQALVPEPKFVQPAALKLQPVKSHDRASRSSKYTQEIPLDSEMLAQVQDGAAIDLDAELSDNNNDAKVPPEVPSVVEKVAHPYVSNVQVDARGGLPVEVRSVGNVCRFAGKRPLFGCPKEAPNGCVDRVPCDRECVTPGYFNYRCIGPVELTSKPDATQPTPPTPARPHDVQVRELASRIRFALEGGDYNALARAIVDAQHSSPEQAALALQASLQLNSLAQAGQDGGEVQQQEEVQAPAEQTVSQE